MIGADAKVAPPVIKAFGDLNASVRRRADFSLDRICARSDMIVPPLVMALDAAAEDVRESVAAALTLLGVAAAPGLAATVEKGPARTRGRPAAILGAFGPEAKAGIPESSRSGTAIWVRLSLPGAGAP